MLTKKTVLFLLLLTMVTALSANKAMALVFQDNFDGSSVDPFWTSMDDNGVSSLSADQQFSGTQSLKCVTHTNTAGTYGTAGLLHNFDQQMQGDVSVRVYDTDPGSAGATYALFNIENIGVAGQRLCIADNSPYNYIAFGSKNSGNWDYLNSRTAGWHTFDFNVGDSGTIMSIDGVVVDTYADLKSFNSLNLNTWTLPGYRSVDF